MAIYTRTSSGNRSSTTQWPSPCTGVQKPRKASKHGVPCLSGSRESITMLVLVLRVVIHQCTPDLLPIFAAGPSCHLSSRRWMDVGSSMPLASSLPTLWGVLPLVRACPAHSLGLRCSLPFCAQPGPQPACVPCLTFFLFLFSSCRCPSRFAERLDPQAWPL